MNGDNAACTDREDQAANGLGRRVVLGVDFVVLHVRGWGFGRKTGAKWEFRSRIENA